MPLKARACERVSKGSSAEVFLLGDDLCRSDSSSENSTLAATPQIGGNPALELYSTGGARRRGDSVH